MTLAGYSASRFVHPFGRGEWADLGSFFFCMCALLGAIAIGAVIFLAIGVIVFGKGR